MEFYENSSGQNLCNKITYASKMLHNQISDKKTMNKL